MRSLGSISQDLCDLQRLHTYNIELGAKDLEWQRQIIGTATDAVAPTTTAPNQPPPRSIADRPHSFDFLSSNVKNASTSNSSPAGASELVKPSLFPSPSKPLFTKTNLDINVVTVNSAKPTQLPVQTPTLLSLNEIGKNTINHRNYVSVKHKADIQSSDPISKKKPVNNPDDVYHFSPLSSESSEPSTTTTTNKPRNLTALNRTSKARATDMVPEEQFDRNTKQSLQNFTNTMDDYTMNANGDHGETSSDSNARSPSTKTVTTAARKANFRNKKKPRLPANRCIANRNGRTIGKIRRHRMTKEEEARFDPADLVDLTGSTAAKSRKMTNEERDIMLHKRRLRNRASAARSRDKQRKTINELSDEMDALLTQSEQLARRCTVVEQRMNQLQSANQMLAKENIYLKQNSLFFLSPPSTSTTAAQRVVSPQRISPCSSSQPEALQRPSLKKLDQGQTVEEPASRQTAPMIPLETNLPQKPHVNESQVASSFVGTPHLQTLQSQPHSQTHPHMQPLRSPSQALSRQSPSSNIELQAQPSIQSVRSQDDGPGAVTPAVAHGFRRTGSLLRVSMSSDMLDKIMGMGAMGAAAVSGAGTSLEGGIMEGSKGLMDSSATNNVMACKNPSNFSTNDSSSLKTCNSSLVRIPSKLHVSLSTDKLQDASFAFSSSNIPLARNFSVMERLLDLANANSSFDINCDVHVRE